MQNIEVRIYKGYINLYLRGYWYHCKSELSIKKLCREILEKWQRNLPKQ